MIKVIPLAIPVFIALIAVEIVVARLQRRPDYLRLTEAISALACGITSQVIKVFYFGVSVAVYTWVYNWAADWNGGFWWSGTTAFAWIFALFAYDHQYYWWHRHSHRVNFMWAAHVVHHQSQDYNLAVALRQALFTRFTSLPYHLPLALIGVPPMLFAVSGITNLLYQYWIHTRTIGKLGPLEWVLNTPSHHRVHHGINPQYIDKNHAGIFIIWDRLFGTFAEEKEEPIYGTVSVMHSFDPIWANFTYWKSMAEVAWHTPKWQNKLLIWFMPPEWSPDGPKTIPEVSHDTFQKWDVPVARGMGPYLILQFALTVVATVWVLWMNGEISLLWLSILSAFIFWTVSSISQLMRRSSVGWPSEVLRMLSLPVVTYALITLPGGSSSLGALTPWLLPTMAGWAALSLGTLIAFRTGWRSRAELDEETGFSQLQPLPPRGSGRALVPTPGK